MKLAFFNDYQLGVIDGDQIVDVASALGGISYHSPQELIETLIKDWDNLHPQIAAAAEGSAGIGIDGVRLRPPLPRPNQLVCLAGNYIEPAAPDRGEFNAFLKSPTGIIGKRRYGSTPRHKCNRFPFRA